MKRFSSPRITEKETHGTASHLMRRRPARTTASFLEGDTLARLSDLQLNSPKKRESSQPPSSLCDSDRNNSSMDSEEDGIDKNQSSDSLNDSSSSSSSQYDHSQDSSIHYSHDGEESSQELDCDSNESDTDVEENATDEEYVLEDDETINESEDLTFDEEEEEYLRHSRILGKDLSTPSSTSIQDFQDDSFYTESTNHSKEFIVSPSPCRDLKKSVEVIAVIDENDSFNTTLDSAVVIAQIVDEEEKDENEDDEIIQSNATTTRRGVHVVQEGIIKSSDTHIRKPFQAQVQTIKKGKWTLGSKIGVGSFGVVHVGMNTLTGTLMAVKCIHVSSDIETMGDLEREIHMMRSLSHMHIVRYIGVERDALKGMLYIFQEWVPGGSVSTLLSKFGPFSTPVIRSYLQQIVLGLQYLHSKNILHRDIKGGNVLVNDEGIVKLADFGSSKQMLSIETLESSSTSSSSRVDDVMEHMTMRGTPYFMAMEVFEEKYGQKADIWSCAGVAFQMLTGQSPWKDLGLKSPMSLYMYLKKTEGPPPIPKGMRISLVDVNLKNLLNECFDRDPKKRPSASELLDYDFFHVEEETDENESYNSPNSNKWGQSPPFLSPINRKRLQCINLDDNSEEIKQKSPEMLKYDSSEWPEWVKN